MYPTKGEMNQEWMAVDGYVRYHLLPSRLIYSYIGFYKGEPCKVYIALDHNQIRVWHLYFQFEEDGTPKLLKAIPLVEEQK